ncbi:glutathione S-transferase [uncultured Sphingomonas sp.]|uniref:glutathione S-transferase family protein n=1 Tax=uncultured Sphingomonas sp. TaxID=158754 RepID=UPI002634ADF6|nr:glutathione S-transferase [uncultured Sphingomonas sp.]
MLTLHHLNFSRSTRVLWLLEELGIDYDLVRYERTPGFRAPETLKAVHPLGKAPVLEDDELTLAESATILTYLATRYGDGDFLPPAGTAEAALHDEWLQYGESSAALPIMMTLFGGMMGGLPDVMRGFADSEREKAFAYIAARLRAGGPYLMGETFTIADIQLAYLLDVAQSSGMLTAHPQLDAYLETLRARPALAKALEIGGPMHPRGGS